MSDKSNIEWTDSTFNPWIGCTKVSPACDHCYAAVSTPARSIGIEWGAGKPRRRTSEGNWKLPYRWNRQDFRQCGDCGWRGAIDTLESDCCPACGEHEKLEPARRRVFCASLADVFDNEVDPAWRRDLFALIVTTPNLDWLLLTKRIGNVITMIEQQKLHFARHVTEWRLFDEWLAGRPPANVWLGATICNQAEADRDIPKLLATPARVRFLSIEPLLGPVDLSERAAKGLPIYWEGLPEDGPLPHYCGHSGRHLYDAVRRGWVRYSARGVDWIIVGGESGNNARPMHPDWARSLRDQCAAAGVPFLFKQWGTWEPRYYTDAVTGARLIKFSTTRNETLLGDPQRPSTHVNMMRVGKKRAGRDLDGVLHDGYPNELERAA